MHAVLGHLHAHPGICISMLNLQAYREVALKFLEAKRVIFFLTIHIKMVGINPIAQVGFIPTCAIGFELVKKTGFLNTIIGRDHGEINF